ncbi:cation:proton antiporter [Nocardia sp. CDC153]|uniref:cation:proton antiporter n=1 Tax=Nocardia sp. CDC153 TaxID=3112167 RepID=UPI002DB6E48F|nr:cation:proton antiporter [Nocardia sp. CDC153]MEC3956867.1 cation:proton antiporter [Nocardia sp. CDC153]
MTVALGSFAPLPAHALLVFFAEVAVLLVAARLLGALALRIGLPALAGELLAGLLLGPSVLAHLAPGAWGWLFPPEVAQIHLLDAVGQIGVVLLVGLAGMQLDVKRLRARAGAAARISLTGLVIPLALGIGIGLVLPTPTRPDTTRPIVFALFLGVAVAVTAIPVIAKVLMELRLTHRNIGQLILGAAMLDDIVAWFLLSLVSALATAGTLGVGTVLPPIGYLCGVALFAVTVGRVAVRRVLHRAEASADPAATSGTVVVLLVAGAAATQAMGLEAILGAFVIGMVIGSSDLRPAALAPLNSVVMSVLAPLYFATAGLRMDLSAIGRPPVLLAGVGILAVAIVGKFAGAFLGGAWSGLNRFESLAVGAGMNARGVVEVIVATVGLRLGVLGTEAYTVLILVAVVTSIMAPPILRRAMARSEVTAEENLRAQHLAPLLGEEAL